MEAELILYAVPRGPLAVAVDRFFAAVAARPTQAQEYPPHCTLTGFFHVDADTISRYVEAAGNVAREVRVDVAAIRRSPDFIGLDVSSPDLEHLARAFAEAVGAVPGLRDPVRAKDWLHVSLAYGHDPADTDDLARLATKLVDPTADVEWELRLYERRDGDWITRGAWPLPNREAD